MFCEPRRTPPFENVSDEREQGGFISDALSHGWEFSIDHHCSVKAHTARLSRPHAGLRPEKGGNCFWHPDEKLVNPKHRHLRVQLTSKPSSQFTHLSFWPENHQQRFELQNSCAFKGILKTQSKCGLYFLLGKRNHYFVYIISKMLLILLLTILLKKSHNLMSRHG